MASIQINNLNPTGSDLFSNSESYLNDLDESEELGIHGGMWMYIAGVAGVITCSAMFGC
ncbi:hypothetical protein [Chroococcus sp. FPU101]|uniref:hypothetical protein n=1 Tax=Chroococcus sp. FPU101 TaxID=1974212 RepID=UPI001A8CDBDF|nr:hypothetical protein [Chroococcus sp. FPU101]GFE68855.1 hypothetical protein CFPU101_14650 [Chroococcus sp. FPU101]